MPTYPGDPGRHELVLAVLQPANEVDVRVDAGKIKAQLFGGTPIVYEAGRDFAGGVNQPFVPTPGEPTQSDSRRARASRTCVRGPINNWTDAAGHGAIVLAIDPITGEAKWKFQMTDVTDTGIVTTAIRSADHRRPRRLSADSRCPDRHAVVEDRILARRC